MWRCCNNLLARTLVIRIWSSYGDKDLSVLTLRVKYYKNNHYYNNVNVLVITYICGSSLIWIVFTNISKLSWFNIITFLYSNLTLSVNIMIILQWDEETSGLPNMAITMSLSISKSKSNSKWFCRYQRPVKRVNRTKIKLLMYWYFTNLEYDQRRSHYKVSNSRFLTKW